MSFEKMTPPQLRKECREREITHFEDGRPITNTAKKHELLRVLGVKKRGKSSWKPARKLDVRASEDVKSNFRLRWRDKDSQNIQRAKAEGWEFVDPTTGIRAEHENPGDSNPLNSTTEYRELVLMGLPEEIAQERDQYMQEQTDKSVEGVKKQLERDLREKGTGTYGDEMIRIS